MPALLLVLSLLFGLWVAAAHGPEHPGLVAHDDPCAVCVLAQGLGGALGYTPLALLLAVGFVLVVARPLVVRALRPVRRIRVRGPPLELV